MLYCIVPNEFFIAGETAICLLKGSDIAEIVSKYESAIFFAQVHGHINADFRWLKSTSKLADVFIGPSNLTLDSIPSSVDNPVSLPSHCSSQCIFLTPRIAISPTHIIEGGVFLEFEVPRETLSSFKGLCASINYYVNITVQHPTGKEELNFPINVTGFGSDRTPCHMQHSSLVSYPIFSLPVEVLLSAPTIASSYGNQGESERQHNSRHSKEVANVYMVRDRDHICDLHLSSQSVAPGGEVEIHLDFTDCIQPCSVVRATIVISEVRPDGSRIQEKVVCKSIRTATDAEYLNMIMSVSSGLPCSCKTPLFSAEYRVDLDFCLDQRQLAREAREARHSQVVSDESNSGDGAKPRNTSPIPNAHHGVGLFDGAFSFSIPLLVAPSAVKEATQGADMCGSKNYSSVVSVQQNALKCLASQFVIFPLHN